MHLMVFRALLIDKSSYEFLNGLQDFDDPGIVGKILMTKIGCFFCYDSKSSIHLNRWNAFNHGIDKNGHLLLLFDWNEKLILPCRICIKLRVN